MAALTSGPTQASLATAMRPAGSRQVSALSWGFTNSGPVPPPVHCDPLFHCGTYLHQSRSPQQAGFLKGSGPHKILRSEDNFPYSDALYLNISFQIGGLLIEIPSRPLPTVHC